MTLARSNYSAKRLYVTTVHAGIYKLNERTSPRGPTIRAQFHGAAYRRILRLLLQFCAYRLSAEIPRLCDKHRILSYAKYACAEAEIPR